MNARDNSKRTEGSLLILTILILSVGMALVFFAKSRDGVPTEAVNINTATANDFALAFEMDPILADLIIAHRNRLNGFEQNHQLNELTVLVSSDEKSIIKERLVTASVDPNIETVDGLERKLLIPRQVAMRIISYRDNLDSSRFKLPSDILRVPLIDDKAIQLLGDRLITRQPITAFALFAFWCGILLASFMLVPLLLRRWNIGGDPFLLPIAFLLTGLGILVLYSVKDPLRDTAVFVHHIKGALLGMGSLLFFAKLSNTARRSLRRFSYIWVILAVCMLLVLKLFGSGPESVRLSVFGIQPVEIIKLLLILFVSGYLCERGDLIADSLHKWKPPILKGNLAKLGLTWPRWQDVGPILTMYVVALGLFLVIRDMGPALVLFGAFISIMYVATGRSGIALMGIGMMVFGEFIGYVLKVGVLPVRIDMWLAPWNNSHPSGMQLGQSLWGMASGGSIGSGLGLGNPAIMPRSGSDLVFSSLCEELGVVGGFFVLFLFTVLIWRGLKIAIKTPNDFDRLLALGLTCLLGSEVFFIVAGVTGLFPLTGITLPFISYGNSAMLAAFVQLGLLRGISAPSGSVAVGLGAKPVFQKSAQRFGMIASTMLLGIIGLFRLGWIQSINADVIAGKTIKTPDADKVARAKVNPRLLVIERKIPRGDILDRNGVALATSNLIKITAAFGDDSAKARKQFLKGRYYPRGEDFAFIVGYVDPAVGGRTGIEKDFNTDLRGFEKYSDLMSDYKVKDLPRPLKRLLTGHSERRGSNVVLTLDADLQHSAIKILKERAGNSTDSVTGRRKNKGAMVMLDPLSGNVLVSASIPSFDPNGLTVKIWKTILADQDKSHRMLDRSRTGYYPPGSTMKVATAGIAMEEGVDPLYDCQHVARNLKWQYGGIHYGRKALNDDEGDPPHDQLRMANAIKVSCNLYFANIGLTLGPDKLFHGLSDTDKWGFSRVKPLSTFAADLPMNAFGQGTMVVTPTEMARTLASVANNGATAQPNYWQSVKTADGAIIRQNGPHVIAKPMLPENAARLTQMLVGVTTLNHGTAKGVFDGLGATVAGKTGTAQTESGDGEPHSWFAGFAPADNPRVAFSCVIENGGYGKTGAAPAINDMLKVYFK